VRTLEELKKIRDKAKIAMNLRNMDIRYKIIVGMGESGLAKGAKDILKSLIKEVEERQIQDVIVSQCGEGEASDLEPVVWVIEKDKEHITYVNMDIEKAKRIVVEHLINGNPVKEYMESANVKNNDIAISDGISKIKQKYIDLLICYGSGCTSAGAGKVKEKFIEVFKAKNMTDDVQIIEAGCMGPCSFAPVIMVYPDGIFYEKLTDDDVEELVEEHFIKGRVVKRLMQKLDGEVIRNANEIPFYKKQVKVALKFCGFLNPENIEEYIALGGYEALFDILHNKKPEDVIELINKSNLRGRGGAGFPTGMKWNFVNKATGSPKYVVCNADEGDPGAYMDRSILEGDPHGVIEGMMIAAYATGASKGFFYIRAEYPLAIKRINLAIRVLREKGLLGNNIIGTNFSFDIEVRSGAGAFVCGEETALIASIEGKRGTPTNKPPFPAQSGLWGKPTLVNNVETLANVAPIFRLGPEWFSSMGSEKSKGTKVFALTGDVENTGLVEIPMGITVKELIEDVGGGIVGDHEFKAVQLGGPSGGCLTKEHEDVIIDYENLTARGAMMGSGGVIVMNDTNCMVNVAKYFLDFSLDESCGKCAPCRIGLKQMFNILDKITKGHGKMEHLDELQTLGATIKQISLCGLGQTAPNPVLTTIRYFKDEYVAHIIDKKCPTGECAYLRKYLIDQDKCVGCTKCARVCPNKAILGSVKKKHEIEQDKCIKCGACLPSCAFQAIFVE